MWWCLFSVMNTLAVDNERQKEGSRFNETTEDLIPSGSRQIGTN